MSKRRQLWFYGVVAPCVFILALLAMLPVAKGEVYQVTPMEVASYAVIAADWHQTQHISREPEIFFERNIILGTHPTLGRVDKYFGAVMLTDFVLHRLVPPKYMQWVDPVVVAVEGGQVYLNYQIGLQ